MPRALQTITEGSPPLYVTTFDYMRGVDTTNNPINVALGRAYDAPNFIRDVPGKVRKRMGYHLITDTYTDTNGTYDVPYTFDGKINGIHRYYDTVLVHAGTKLYRKYQTGLFNRYSWQAIQTGLPDAISKAYTVGKKMIILTGETMYCYYDDSTSPVGFRVNTAGYYADQNPPEVSVGRAPHGGGDIYPLNMLTGKFTDCFLSDGSSVVYQLTFYPLKENSVTVKILDNEGAWQDATSTIDYVNYEAGAIRFATAPGSPPVSGEDNVKITAELEDSSDMKSKVNKCSFGIVYGTAGNMDRIFIAGNPDHPNNDYFCAVNNPLFWGDINYGQIGRQDSKITGYSIVDGDLATHKANDDDGRNIFVRQGILDTETEDLTPVEFPITKVIQGMGAIAPYSFAYLHESLYLTRDGIYATTPYEFNGRWYAQRRSYYIDGKLLKETNLEKAVSCVWKDYYCLALNGMVYILDTLQRDESGVVRSSQFQYEAYYFTDLPVRCWYVTDDELWFGSDDGNIYAFYTNKYSAKSYSDNGRAIRARWDFTHIGSNLYLDKTSWWISLTLEAPSRSSFSLYYKKSTDSAFKDFFLNRTFRYFTYSDIDYGDFFYGGGDNVITFGQKLKIKRYDSCRLSIRNYHNKEGIFLHSITLEYEEGRNYKTLRE